MPISRPLTKELLKKLFLKTRHEIRPGGQLSGHGWSIGGIIADIPYLYPELGKSLTNEEKMLVTRAVYELERDGFLWQDISQSESFKILSDLGEKVVTRDLADMRLPSIDIDQLLSRDDLRGLVRDDFNSADYETAVFKAFRTWRNPSARRRGNRRPRSGCL